MKARIDGELCTGHGRCANYGKNIYRLDPNGYNIDRGKVIEIPPDQEEAATLGATNCPEGAITVE